MWSRMSHINNIRHGWLRKKIVRCLGETLGQATTEIAVMGTIILVIFGVLLRYGQMFNAQQEAQMYAFRKSLELAQKRTNDAKFGGATVVVTKEYQPVDLFSSEPQPSMVSGSSTVTLENKQTYFDTDNPVAGEDGPATYYQMGNDMIKNNELIEVPYMYVKRKIGKDKAPRTPMDSTIDVLDKMGGGAKTEYNAYQSAPFWETNQTTNSTYTSKEQRIAYYSSGVKSDYSEVSSKDLNTNTTYEVEPTGKIYDSDEFIKEIYSLPPNMVVEQNQTVEKERSYSAW